MCGLKNFNINFFRDNVSPGWKFNHWELKGVPVRIEVGPKDLAKNEVLTVQRFSGQKRGIPIPNIVDESKKLLEDIHKDMYNKYGGSKN